MVMHNIPSHAHRHQQYFQCCYYQHRTRTRNQEAAASEYARLELGRLMLFLPLRRLRASVYPLDQADDVSVSPSSQSTPSDSANSPSFWIGRIMITWGIVVMCIASVQNYGGLITCRVCKCFFLLLSYRLDSLSSTRSRRSRVLPLRDILPRLLV